MTTLAGFLICHYTDQVKADSKEGQCRVQFHCDQQWLFVEVSG